MQPVIIAHYAVNRILLVTVLCCALLAFCFWSLLHPGTWTYPKEPQDVLFSQIIYFPIIGMGILLVAVGFGFWLVRGRSTVICLKDDTLHFPGGWTIRLDDLTDVRPGIWRGKYHISGKTIELDKRDGNSAWIGPWMLKEDRDVVIARIKDALARHKAP